jgi:hypothetical protein
MLPIWPSGIDIGVEPRKAGRLSLRLAYRAGLNRAKTSYWVQPEHEAELHRLVDAVTTQKEEA